MVELLVQMPDLELGLQVDPIVVEGAQPVLRLLASLAHHDDGRLDSGNAGQEKIEQDVRIGIEGRWLRA